MRVRPQALLAGAGAVALLVAGCGSSGESRQDATVAAATSTRAAPMPHVAQPAPKPKSAASTVAYSPAKRRYLAHFKVGCTSATSLANASSATVSALTNEISRGDVAAVAQLTAYLNRMASSYGAGLHGLQSLGRPPGPDAADGRAYLADAAHMVAAIRQMGQAVGRLDAHGMQTASATLKAATANAAVVGKRYGFPVCGGSGSSGSGGSGSSTPAPSGLSSGPSV